MSQTPAADTRDDRPRRRAVFLDRDGTIVREVDFLRDVDEVELIPGVAAALARLADAGFARVVVTNQSGVARGYIDERQLARIHARMQELLVAEGASVDLILHCPHHPTEGSSAYRRDCDCRKPKAGMFIEAVARLDLDASGSWSVGDSARDLAAGELLGVPGILVSTGKGAAQHAELSAAGKAPEHYVPDLSAAVDRILEP